MIGKILDNNLTGTSSIKGFESTLVIYPDKEEYPASRAKPDIDNAGRSLKNCCNMAFFITPQI